MVFCNLCLNALVPEICSGCTKFRCGGCPYECTVRGIFVEKEQITPAVKVEEDEARARDRPTRQVSCPKCGERLAYYYQMQTRSADEPMTIFNTCVSCDHTWRE